MIDPDNSGLGDPRPRNHMLRPGSKIGQPSPIFAEQARRTPYVFAGLKPFIDSEAQRVHHADHSLRSRMHGDWFVAQASNALGNACCQRRTQDAQASLDRAVALREIMAVALAATESAILEVARNLDLPDPPFAHTEVTNGPRKLRRP